MATAPAADPPAATCQAQATDTGRAGGYADPHLATFVPPPVPAPGSDVRGKTLLVSIFVNASGAVVPDSTRIAPAPRDREFTQNFAASLARRRYRPATLNGCPVGAWVKLSYSFTG